MAHYFLVDRNSKLVCQIVPSQDDTFEVHEDLMWVAGPDTIDEGCDCPEYEYHEPTNSIRRAPVPQTPYELARRMNYDPMMEQLDQLWHDMDSGVVPGKEGIWYQKVKQIKESFPKS